MKLAQPIKEYPHAEKFINDVATTIAHSLSQALTSANASHISLGLSGGGTPKNIYQALAHKELEWAKVRTIVCDERIVSSDHADFNGNMINASLMQHNAQHAEFIPFDLSTKDIESYRQQVQSLLPLDVCILGMGTDGHTASIFHDAANLSELLMDPQQQLLMQTASPRLPQQRLSLTMPALQKSKEIHLLIQGEAKKNALEKALDSQSIEQNPILAIVSLAQTTIHYCA